MRGNEGLPKSVGKRAELTVLKLKVINEFSNGLDLKSYFHQKTTNFTYKSVRNYK